MSLPLAVNGIEAFDEMLSVVKKVSITLKGELLDESGSSFSIQRERYIREQVIEYLFEIKKQNSSNHG
jgi:FtsZ-interacting cell division protein ZipA